MMMVYFEDYYFLNCFHAEALFLLQVKSDKYK